MEARGRPRCAPAPPRPLLPAGACPPPPPRPPAPPAFGQQPDGLGRGGGAPPTPPGTFLSSRSRGVAAPAQTDQQRAAAE
eukprot:gene2715-31217_t